MARPRTPTDLLEAKGSFMKHPDRKRKDPETPSAMDETPPRHLLDRPLTVKVWFEIVSTAPKILTGSDAVHVEVLAELLAEFREDPWKFPVAKLARMEAMLGKLGMNPAARAAMAVETGSRLGRGNEDEPKSKLSDFLN